MKRYLVPIVVVVVVVVVCGRYLMKLVELPLKKEERR